MKLGDTALRPRLSVPGSGRGMRAIKSRFGLEGGSDCARAAEAAGDCAGRGGMAEAGALLSWRHVLPCGSTRPSGLERNDAWNVTIARTVRGPHNPSIGPGLQPGFDSSRCTSITSVR